MVVVSDLLKGHFNHRGHFFEGLYDEVPFLRDIFAEGHFHWRTFSKGPKLEDILSRTFSKGHLGQLPSVSM